MRNPLRGIRAADNRMFKAVHRTHSPRLDAPLFQLSHAANRSLIWVGASVLLAASGARGRRAAVRGLLSIGVTSALVNGPVKLTIRRRRPMTDGVHPGRLLTRIPASSSFPSGHSASAGAFAAAVALEWPAAGIPTGALAGAVGYSRVHTGVHYPIDVLAGLGIGAGVAVATLRLWPLPTPPEVRLPQPHPVAVDAERVRVAANPGSGGGDGFDTAALGCRVETADDADGIEQLMQRLAGDADILGVAGGDGTVATAAAVALEHAVPMLVVPAGTLNHFSRDLGVDTPADAARALEKGALISVDVGMAGDRLFLNTASVGMYVDMVKMRERLEGRIGKWPAAAVALWSTLRHAQPIPVRIDDEEHRVWMIFAGNGRYQTGGLEFGRRQSLDDGLLDLRIIDGDRRWSRLQAVGAALLGLVDRSPVYHQRTTRNVRLELPEGTEIALDGDLHPAPSQLELTVRPRALRVLVPAPE
jgi:diacylglycerol kinase family enzyme/membrane-associated phospholipid phosphatase